VIEKWGDGGVVGENVQSSIVMVMEEEREREGGLVGGSITV